MVQRLVFNFMLALEGVATNQLRAFLTALGIVFGVGAVIAMLAIGTGARQSILEQMKLIGTNSIEIKAVVPDKEESRQTSNKATAAIKTKAKGAEEKSPFSPGLRLEDADAIVRILPGIEKISPEVIYSASLIYRAHLEKARSVGVTNEFFHLNNIRVENGTTFLPFHFEQSSSVCIIGHNIRLRFFNQEDPIGKQIKCGNNWLTVIGVLEKRAASKESLENLGIRDYNADVYLPITTTLIRYRDRSKFDQNDIKTGDSDNDNNVADPNYHQLDRIVIRVKESDQLRASADLIGKILKRRHQQAVDFEVNVPELLLEQQKKTQDTFNFVLAVIAGISLLVGGIGIMNIMLASVLERIKEIGVRRSMGAKQSDIIYQFLFEAVVISLLGGLLGVILGILSANVISRSAGIPTIVSYWSVLLSFGVAAAIGLIFGIIPARKAALEDPIKALRTE